MPHPHADVVRRFWAAADARDWVGFEATLAPDVVYDAPQSRERVRGAAAYTRFNREFPGDWHVTLERVIADDDGAVAHAAFTLDGEPMTGISLFTFDAAGRIATVVDYWPEPYEPSADRAHLVERY